MLFDNKDRSWSGFGKDKETNVKYKRIENIQLKVLISTFASIYVLLIMRKINEISLYSIFARQSIFGI